MKIEAQLDLLTKLHRAATILGVLCIVTMVSLGAFSSAQAASTKFQTKQTESQIQTVKAALPTKIQSASKPIDGSEAVVQFQSRLQQAANERGVVVEFESTGDPVQFMTRYANTGADPEWKQTELQLSIVGSTRQALDLLDSVAEFDVPFEFGDMEIQATQAFESETIVTIRTQIRVLYRSA